MNINRIIVSIVLIGDVTNKMEDPESEWKIQEYHPYSREDDEDANIMKWILTKGYGIGRKIAVTGIVISSVPLVLPPLVVFSAMGVVFSVPFGLLFASYACTNKLMNMLLQPPLMLEYYADECESENNERVDCKLGLDLDDVEENEYDCGPLVEGYVTDKEDNEQIMEDINREIEFELDDDDYRQEWQTFMKNVDEEDMQGVEGFDIAGDSLEEERKEKEQLVENRIDENISNILEVNEDAKLRDEGRVDDTVEEDCVVGRGAYNVAFGDVKDVETTKLVIVEEVKVEVEFEDGEQTEDVNLGVETEILFELDDDYRQKGQTLVTNVDEDVNEREVEMEMEDDTLQIENVSEEKEREQMEDEKLGVEMRPDFDVAGDDQRYDDGLEDEQKGKEPLVDENRSQIEEVNDQDAKLRDKGRVCDMVEEDYVVGESVSSVVFGDVKDVETTKPVTVKDIDSQKLVEIVSKNGEPVGEIHHVVILSNGHDEDNSNSREVEELDLVAKEVIGDVNKDERDIASHEKVARERMGTQEKTGGEDVIMEEYLIYSNADSREIGRLDLLDERKANTNLESLEVGNEVKENAADENVDVLARDTDNAKFVYKKMPSREGNLDDEKIWEKIGAMRTIVGYKAPRQPTCIGELKALFVFTGVEPPASFKGEGESDSDLDEVNAKLKFLMAIVGVK
ncbi:hypothetical protein L1987_63517 [Smallanthus sonchifolius]|uniref:Uncharacterized protein n=1 Tax=Smallanthus sonchifolius TaxID=185202 RepID=A0ACB9CDI8_9ASTR|nr:hypothetical protein L1987_63517 [Smallanthus sonchifolius]